MDKTKLERITELARASKVRPLSEDELAEQKMLRDEYINAMKNNLESQLQGISKKKK